VEVVPGSAAREAALAPPVELAALPEADEPVSAAEVVEVSESALLPALAAEPPAEPESAASEAAAPEAPAESADRAEVSAPRGVPAALAAPVRSPDPEPPPAAELAEPPVAALVSAAEPLCASLAAEDGSSRTGSMRPVTSELPGSDARASAEPPAPELSDCGSEPRRADSG